MSGAPARTRAPSGVVVVDKPRGPTSHDVVARLRRALGTRRVGHAGTLDPMASGVLVVLVGEATKLGPFVTAHDKRYVARVALGVGTSTLDADGEIVARGELAPERIAELACVARGEAPSGALAEALAAEEARTEQVPPAHSAIKVGGKKAYDLARAGKEVELSPRAVEVRSIAVLAAAPPRGDEPASLEVELDVAKGYYVRSFARDLGERLGVPAHLVMLRRLASGPFTIEEAAPLDDPARLVATLLPLASAARRSLPCHVLTPEGLSRARTGKRLADEHFLEAPRDAGPVAWLSPSGELCAVGERRGDEHAVVRGFVETDEPADEELA